MNDFHTPGPWQLEYNPTVGQIHIVHESDELRSHVARLWEATLCDEHGSIKANAALISSAPDLLASLKEIVAFVQAIKDGKRVIECGMMDRARSAIKQAETFDGIGRGHSSGGRIGDSNQLTYEQNPSNNRGAWTPDSTV